MTIFFNTLKILLISVALSSCITADKVDQTKLGNEYAQDGLYREAAEAYRIALKQNPKNMIAKRNLGVVLVKLGAYKKAISHLSVSVKKLTKNYQNNYYLAEAYRATNQFDKAIFHYKTCLKHRPNDYASSKALAWSFYKIKYYKAAMGTINSMQKADKARPQSLIIRARILMKQKRFSKAALIATSLIRNSERVYQPFAKSILGDIYLESGQLTKAKETYKEALKEKPYLAGALLGLGKVYNKSGDHKNAETLLTRAIRLRPSLTEGYMELAKAVESKNPRRAASLYRAFAKRSKNDPEFSGLIKQAREKITVLQRQASSNSKISKSQRPKRKQAKRKTRQAVKKSTF